VSFFSDAPIKRCDFGMNFLQGPVSDEISIILSFAGIRQQRSCRCAVLKNRHFASLESPLAASRKAL